MKKILLLALALILLFVSCEEKVTPPDPEKTATVIYKDLDGNVVTTKYYTEKEFPIAKEDLPAVPAKDGYKDGTWFYDGSAVEIGTEKTVTPYYFSTASYENGMPKSILMADGREIWITDRAITGYDTYSKTISYVDIDDSLGKVYFEQSELRDIADRFKNDPEAKDAFNLLPAKEKSDALMAMGMTTNMLKKIKYLREGTENNTWSFPKYYESGYILDALLRYYPEYYAYMTGTAGYAYMITSEFFGLTGNSTGIHNLTFFNKTGSVANMANHQGGTEDKAYLWPISFQPLEEEGTRD